MTVSQPLCTFGALLAAEHSTIGVTEVRTFRNEVAFRCSGFSDFDGLAREGFVCEEAFPVSLGGIVEISRSL